MIDSGSPVPSRDRARDEGRVLSLRTGGVDGQRTRKEIVYGIVSLPACLAGPEHLNHYVRGHWCVENRLHWTRDVTFHEDNSQLRTGTAPRALASFRNLTLNTYRLAGRANIAHAAGTYTTAPTRSPSTAYSKPSPNRTERNNAGALGAQARRSRLRSAGQPSNCRPRDGENWPSTCPTPATSRQWTDDGKRSRRQLEHRGKDEVRFVPVPPPLTALLQRHLAEFGTMSDGRLFWSPRGGPLAEAVYGRAWREARRRALTPAEAASPLAARPYDLRHAAVSTWLNAGVPATQVAEWAGHSVRILLKVYAKCILGQDEAAR